MPNRRRRQWRFRLTKTITGRKVLIGLGGAILFGVFSLVLAFAWFSRDLPNPDKISDRLVVQSTKIYDRTGETVLYDIHGEEKRTIVELDAIAETMKQATIVAEDRHFYEHKGFDLRGIFRAVFKNVTRLDPTGEGGSTITQQFIKQSVLTSEKSYVRKIKELVLAYQIEQRFSKEEILKLYLNEIPYGANAYGVEAAANLFFNTSAKNLTLAQSALLAALPRAPTYYSPYGEHTEDLFNRQRFILDGLAEEGYVTNEDAEAAKAEKLTVAVKREPIIAPHFVFYVRDLLAKKYGETALLNGGLKVITSLDMKNQEAAETAIADRVATNEERWNATNASLVSLDTKTGQVLAMVGSRDYFDTERDGNVNVALRPRQPGSSFKPIVYTTAFEKGYTPETMVFDLVTNFDAGGGKPYTPHNYDSTEHGPLSLRKALAGSLNIPAVKVLYLTGVNRVLDTAEKIGYSTFGERDRFGLSLVLGGAEVRLLEHTSAFATLAREGVRHAISPILKVEDANGKVLEEFHNQETRVLDEEAVRDTNSILTDDGARAFIFGARGPLTLPDRTVAAKTGTTNDYRDAWTLGFTPSLATGVWVGNNDNSEMKRGADGSIVAAPIWNAYMRKMLSGTPVETFKAPKKNDAKKPVLKGEIDVIVKLPVDRVTRKVIPESCRNTYPKEFIEEASFKTTHTILHWVQKDDPGGPEPTKPESDPQYALWEAPVRAWARKNNYPDIAALPKERCDLREGATAPTATITAPVSGTTLTEQTNIFTATVTGRQDIASVSFSIDGVEIGTDVQAPFTASYTNRRFRNGNHALTVLATDVLGLTTQAESPFQYALPASTALLTVTTPQDGATFLHSDLPFDVGGIVFDPLGISTLTLSADGTTLDAKNNPENGAYSFTISSLGTGRHLLSLTLTNPEGATRTATVHVEIQSNP